MPEGSTPSDKLQQPRRVATAMTNLTHPHPKTTFIYALLHPLTKEVRYIGKSNKPADRAKSHCQDLSPKNHKVQWIKSLKSQGLKPELMVLQEVLYEEWIKAEKEWIRHYKKLGNRLTNSCEGGKGSPNPSLESRAKMSISHRGSISKLSDAQVLEIWHFLINGMSFEEVCKIYDVKKYVIWEIVNGSTRSYINPPIENASEIVRNQQKNHTRKFRAEQILKHRYTSIEAITGSRNKSAKLTEEKVGEICNRLIAGETNKNLALEYGVYVSVIEKIKANESWKHVQVVDRVALKALNNKLPDQQVKEICNRLLTGEKPIDVARVYGLSPVVIHGIKMNKTYCHIQEVDRIAIAKIKYPAYRNGLSKFTCKDIIAIKKMFSDGFRNFEIAKFYGVSSSTISMIRSEKSWKDVV